MVWLPSDAPEADERPFILLVPGGGFVNVWNLTEGWPVAAQFNSEGYHVFILTYQVDGKEKLIRDQKAVGKGFDDRRWRIFHRILSQRIRSDLPSGESRLYSLRREAESRHFDTRKR